MVEIGKINKLRVVKEVDFGRYLDGEEFGEILLPKKYVPNNTKKDSRIEVFVYLDSEDRLIATTQKPLAKVGEFANLKVVSISTVGAFLNWGLDKDLLVPYREQKQRMTEGKYYVVYVYLDEKSNRIAASTKLNKFLNKFPSNFRTGQEVQLLISNESENGVHAIINGTHMGMIYNNDIFMSLETGQKIKGFIKNVRDDNKIDLVLQKPGVEKVEDSVQLILDILKEQDGYIAVNDKTPPAVINKLFGISKKTFKKSIGILFKKRLIVIDKKGIKLKNTVH